MAICGIVLRLMAEPAGLNSFSLLNTGCGLLATSPFLVQRCAAYTVRRSCLWGV